MEIALFVSAFVLGIGGSLHCLGMCGPLALSLPFAPIGGGSVFTYLRKPFYFLGKSMAYGCLGAILGTIGKGVQWIMWQQGLSILAGSFLLLFSMVPILKRKGVPFPFQRTFARAYERISTQGRLKDYLLIGFLNGLLPCGLVYTAMALAALSGAWAPGFLVMFVFGLGTVPALWALTVLKSKIRPAIRSRFRPMAKLLTLGVGLLLILRGLNLGIAYVSPASQDGKTLKECCHKP